jgi:hypothetical protein
LRKTADFTFLQHDQPSEAAWKEANLFAAEWNKRNEPQFSTVMGFLLTINFRDQRLPVFSEFLQSLQTTQNSSGIKYLVSSETIFEEEDYRGADFVEILGISLEGFAGRPFILNDRVALGQPIPCPACGWQDIFNAPQRGPFAIDETLLDLALPEGGDKPPGGWDCINLPNGHKLVSKRIVALLEEGNVRGYELLPVREESGAESRRMFQILARKTAIMANQPGGAEIPLCHICGAARSLSEGDQPGMSSVRTAPAFCVRKDALGGDEVLSRHPGKGAMLYVAQRVYRLLMASHLNGLIPSDIISLC